MGCRQPQGHRAAQGIGAHLPGSEPPPTAELRSWGKGAETNSSSTHIRAMCRAWTAGPRAYGWSRSKSHASRTLSPAMAVQTGARSAGVGASVTPGRPDPEGLGFGPHTLLGSSRAPGAARPPRRVRKLVPSKLSSVTLMVLETVKPGLHLGVTRILGPKGHHLQEASGGRQKGVGSLGHSPCPARPPGEAGPESPVHAHTCGRSPRTWLSVPGPWGSHQHLTTYTPDPPVLGSARLDGATPPASLGVNIWKGVRGPSFY